MGSTPQSGIPCEANGAAARSSMLRFALLILVLAALAAGCGGGQASTPPPPPPAPISVTVTSASDSVLAGGTVPVSSTLSNDTAKKGVTWTISPATGAGTLSNITTTSVIYNAPAAPPASDFTVTITATAVADTTKAAATTITVPAISVSITSDIVTVQAGGKAFVSAAAQSDPSNKGVTWTILPTTGAGTLSDVTSSSVTYNAPAAVPPADVPVTVTATSVTDPSKSIALMLNYAAILVVVSPSATSLEAGSSVDVSGAATNDPANKGVTWALSPATGAGTLTNVTDASATYNAPATPPANDLTVVVTATSVSDTTKTGQASLVVPAIAISVLPAAALLPVNTTQTFTGIVSNDPANQGVNWSVAQNGTNCAPQCGTVSPASTASAGMVTYTAPASVPANPLVNPTATSISDSTRSGAARVTLTTGSVKLVPTVLSFGSVKTMASKALPVTLTNTGSGALNMNGFTFAGTNAFSETDDCGASVAAGATCTITVTFRPTTITLFSGTMSISDSSSDSPQVVDLSGRGIRRFHSTSGVAAALSASSVNEVPRPSGPSVVATRVIDLVDATRDDPYLGNGTKRELLVRFWYPAASGEACRPAEYTSARVWKQFSKLLEIPLPQINTNSCSDASVAEGEHAVVVFTHGYTGTFTDYTFLFEDLASRGYVVASVDHTYEATAVEFPDGRFIESAVGSHLGGELREDRETLEFAVAARLGDLKFVGRELSRLNGDPKGAFLGRLDMSKIALAGHSLGGWTAIRGVNDEPIFKASVSIDGSIFAEPAILTEKPVLLLGAGRELWSEEEKELWAGLHGPRFAVNLPGAEHRAPSDAVWLARYAIQTGAVSPQKAIATVRDYVAAFLDANLRGQEASSLLKGPSPRYPGAVVTTQKESLRSKN